MNFCESCFPRSGSKRKPPTITIGGIGDDICRIIDYHFFFWFFYVLHVVILCVFDDDGHRYYCLLIDVYSLSIIMIISEWKERGEWFVCDLFFPGILHRKFSVGWASYICITFVVAYLSNRLDSNWLVEGNKPIRNKLTMPDALDLRYTNDCILLYGEMQTKKKILGKKIVNVKHYELDLHIIAYNNLLFHCTIVNTG